MILANIASLERLISRLRRREAGSTWSDYAPTTSYSEEDAARKARFVHEALATRRLGLAWDLGCNDGRHARIAAEHADYVVAVDGDELVGDRLYEALKREGATRILPLTMDLVDPSPGLGWRGLERRSLIERGRPDATLCLALVHHVSIGGNVPIRDIVDWLATLGGKLVIEFPTPQDPQVGRLLARRQPRDHADYTRDWFETCLSSRFEIRRVEELAGGARVLYDAESVT